jgi:hypothetical protein
METEVTTSDDGKRAGAVDFAAFLTSAAGQAACGSELIARLWPSAASITSLPNLLRWARERHPDQYPAQDWRAPLSKSAAPYGSQAVKGIWSRYLQWRELSVDQGR